MAPPTRREEGTSQGRQTLLLSSATVTITLRRLYRCALVTSHRTLINLITLPQFFFKIYFYIYLIYNNWDFLVNIINNLRISYYILTLLFILIFMVVFICGSCLLTYLSLLQGRHT